jgi:hypothetical protein
MDSGISDVVLSDFRFVATIAGWILLFGVPGVWFAGLIGVSESARRIPIFTPCLTALVGVVILFSLQRWPFQ